MARFTLRNPGGGSSLRDPVAPQALRDQVGVTATFGESLADVLVFATPAGGSGEAITDEAGNPITDEAGNPITVGDAGGGDRLAARATHVEALVFTDSTGGGGSAYVVALVDTLVLTDANVTTLGTVVGNAYTHAFAESLQFNDANTHSVNAVEVRAFATLPTAWGTAQRWNAWVEVSVAGQVVASSQAGDFELLGGRVTEDLARAVSADVTVELGFDSELGVPHRLLPRRLGDVLDPNNHTHLHVYAGYEGSEVSLGVFDLARTPISVDPSGTRVTMAGMSLERLLQRAGFWAVTAYPAGVYMWQVVLDLTRQIIPDVRWSIETNTGVIPETTFKPGDDRLEAVRKLAEASSAMVRFDRQGGLLMRNVVPPAERQGNVRWTVSDGLDGSVATLLSAEREFQDEDSYNGVTIEGGRHSSGSDEPIYWTQWIPNPLSPLYWDPARAGVGRRGPRPKLVRNEFVTDHVMAEQAAVAHLFNWLAVVDTVTVTTPANPAVELDHFVRFKCSALGVDAPYRVVRATHDLGGGPLELVIDRPLEAVNP